MQASWRKGTDTDLILQFNEIFLRKYQPLVAVSSINEQFGSDIVKDVIVLRKQLLTFRRWEYNCKYSQAIWKGRNLTASVIMFLSNSLAEKVDEETNCSYKSNKCNWDFFLFIRNFS